MALVRRLSGESYDHRGTRIAQGLKYSYSYKHIRLSSTERTFAPTKDYELVDIKPSACSILLLKDL